ncbi:MULTISPECIES: hypothetical protein [Nocardia]|uniref:hypothetical protein n=1 Tax=Nocardia abscessus TaxID=120957 RepID=UPI001E343B24|nr:hypothetical protein [Nocardia abscessus]
MPPIVAPAGPVPLPATGGIEYVSVRPTFAVGYADRRSWSSRCASGFLRKDARAAELLHAIRVIADGDAAGRHRLPDRADPALAAAARGGDRIRPARPPRGSVLVDVRAATTSRADVCDLRTRIDVDSADR